MEALSPNMSAFAIIEAPSVLGLFPKGVETLPEALLGAGLAERLGARREGRLEPPPYDPHRDSETLLLNPRGLRDYALQLAEVFGVLLDAGERPFVLGGDCSILLGPALALRRRGRFGLLFIDGHADFYQPEAEPNGEAASMELALVTGRGPDIVANLENRRPLVRDEDVVVFGRRDGEIADEHASQRVEDTSIHLIDLATVRREGVTVAASQAVEHLTKPALDGFFIHLDCDALDDAIMPAVDYRLAGGLSWNELSHVLRTAFDTRRVVGIEVTIFNPTLDARGALARSLVSCLSEGLTPSDRGP